jgi:predicted lipoprotein with Yx(FWY)xxD motif
MTLNHFLAALLTTASITVAGPSLAQAIKSTDGLMTDAQGKTLYLFTKDTANKSNCSGGCLAAWPAFIPKPEAQPNGDLGIITREDGTRQWTHNAHCITTLVTQRLVTKQVTSKAAFGLFSP